VSVTESLEISPAVDEITMESVTRLVSLSEDEVAVGVLRGVEVELVEELDDGYRMRLRAHASVEVADRWEGHLLFMLTGSNFH